VLVKGSCSFRLYVPTYHTRNYRIYVTIKYYVPEIKVKRKIQFDFLSEHCISAIYGLFLDKTSNINDLYEYFRDRVVEDIRTDFICRNDNKKLKDLLKLIKDSNIKFEFDIDKEEVEYEQSNINGQIN
jgi:hypothetical protein